MSIKLFTTNPAMSKLITIISETSLKPYIDEYTISDLRSGELLARTLKPLIDTGISDISNFTVWEICYEQSELDKTYYVTETYEDRFLRAFAYEYECTNWNRNLLSKFDIDSECEPLRRVTLVDARTGEVILIGRHFYGAIWWEM